MKTTAESSCEVRRCKVPCETCKACKCKQNDIYPNDIKANDTQPKDNLSTCIKANFIQSNVIHPNATNRNDIQPNVINTIVNKPNDIPLNETLSNDSHNNDIEQSRTKLDDIQQHDIKTNVILTYPTIGCFTGIYSVAILITSTLTSYVNSQVTTLERQFGFSSKQTGLITSANDVGFLTCVLLTSYLASRINIPKFLGISCLLYGFSGLVCSMPHFLFGLAQGDNFNVTAPEGSVPGIVCRSNVSTTACLTKGEHGHSSESSQHHVTTVSLVIIVAGMMLQGVGKSPRACLFIKYVDDNTKRTNTGFLADTNLTPLHPKWIGAWWLGYVLIGCASLIAAIPLFFFPKTIQSQKSKSSELTARSPNKDNLQSTKLLLDSVPCENIPMDNITQSVDTTTRENRLLMDTTRENRLLMDTTRENEPKAIVTLEDFQEKESYMSKVKRKRQMNKAALVFSHFKGFCMCMRRLLTNPVYMCVVVSNCFIIFNVSGGSAFGAKYLENMFNLPAYKANYILAGQTFTASCLGVFIGGFVTRRLKMTPLAALKFTIVVYVIALAGTAAGFFLQCEQPAVHGRSREQIECNRDCDCKDESYFPVCGQDGITYYSPCLAGCSGFDKVYTNCTCVPGGEARIGTCDYGCWHLYVYVLCMGIRQLFSPMSVVPKVIVVIRSVNRADRAMAVGLNAFVTSIFGWLLGPVVFGMMIDGICVIWEAGCGGRGRCLLYDHAILKRKFHAYIAVPSLLSLLFIVAAYVYGRCTKSMNRDEDANVAERLDFDLSV
ncbi:solute carrier organic anion transporter family member 2A1-like isoform X2 [Physella acuta]|uniref:solute carrier organic anion transporter family member 2A1-like isoform X2 n=1 Tax=Physella acuta TaxID=109671 RepID=UPI0027DE3DED|nr:solute carrier organic anion transporter family member 2A1-like isoform X2 [Physella acuta]